MNQVSEDSVEFELTNEADSNGDRDKRLMLPHAQWSNRPSDQCVSILINYSIDQGGSDIFFACEEDCVSVSIRQLGVIRCIAELPLEQGFRCIAHIRAVAGLKIDERRRPLDGRWIFQGGGSTVDLRLNTIPTLYGETLAMRVLPRNSDLWNLEALGFVGPQLGTVKEILRRRSGLVLVTGPTGSGKSTTLYACLHQLNNEELKIHTVEDPIEYSVPGLHQSQVDDAHGASFFEYLRAIVRQGPDVIMIGEVRDSATAEAAVRAANSGQLVFATVHAPIAVKAIQSLLALGVSPYLLSSSLLAVIGQRLVRELSREHLQEIDLSAAPHTFDEVRPWLKPGEGGAIYSNSHSNGVANAGYSRRSAVFEVIMVSPQFKRLIREETPSEKLAEHALAEGAIDFRRAALLKVARGEISFDEMYRALPSSDELDGEELY